MSRKCCFEKVPGWWAQSPGYWLWIPLLSVANNRLCCTGFTHNNIQRIQGTPNQQHQQPYSTLVPGKSPSKIGQIKEGISRCKWGYGAWGLPRELPVSDPGQDTKLPLIIYYKDADGNLQHIPCFISDDNAHTAPVLFARFRNHWWNSWSRGSQTSQRSIMFLMAVVGNIKISRTSLIYVPIKRTFPSKQSGFSLQLATGNHGVMELVVQWNAMLRRGSKMVIRYPVKEAVIISFPSQHHKLDTNCAVRITHLWTSMTSKFQLELILVTLHHHLTSLACTIPCGGLAWWTKLMRSKVT